MDLLPSFIIAFIGNIIPVPFILMFIKFIFKKLKKTRMKGFIEKIENKAMSKSDQIQKYAYLGLFLFVGIPLPGTGAWTGTLAASFLDMGFKKSVIAVMLGVIIAGIIMALASMGLFGGISFLFAPNKA